MTGWRQQQQQQLEATCRAGSTHLSSPVQTAHSRFPPRCGRPINLWNPALPLRAPAPPHTQMFRKRKDKFPMHLEQTYLRYMMFVIESAIANMKNGQEQWIWVLDLSGEKGCDVCA